MAPCTKTLIIWFVVTMLTTVLGFYVAMLLPTILGTMIAIFIMVMVPMWIALTYIKRKKALKTPLRIQEHLPRPGALVHPCRIGTYDTFINRKKIGVVVSILPPTETCAVPLWLVGWVVKSTIEFTSEPDHRITQIHEERNHGNSRTVDSTRITR